MDEEKTMIGRGRDAIDMIVDKDSFIEGKIGEHELDPEYGPGSVVGTAKLEGNEVTVIANDAQAFNERFPVVFGGVIGMEEAYKMANAVYDTIAADKDKPLSEKRAIVLIVDTPGNGPGKLEEIAGMNKATGSYQLALAEARKTGHPIIAMVIGRAISVLPRWISNGWKNCPRPIRYLPQAPTSSTSWAAYRKLFPNLKTCGNTLSNILRK